MRYRCNQINVYLSDCELRQLEKLSHNSGLSYSALIRQLLMKQDVKCKPPEHYMALLRELTRIGTNINQIARVANMSGSVGQEEIAKMQVMLGEIWREVKRG